MQSIAWKEGLQKAPKAVHANVRSHKLYGREFQSVWDGQTVTVYANKSIVAIGPLANVMDIRSAQLLVADSLSRNLIGIKRKD